MECCPSEHAVNFRATSVTLLLEPDATITVCNTQQRLPCAECTHGNDPTLFCYPCDPEISSRVLSAANKVARSCMLSGLQGYMSVEFMSFEEPAFEHTTDAPKQAPKQPTSSLWGVDLSFGYTHELAWYYQESSLLMGRYDANSGGYMVPKLGGDASESSGDSSDDEVSPVAEERRCIVVCSIVNPMLSIKLQDVGVFFKSLKKDCILFDMTSLTGSLIAVPGGGGWKAEDHELLHANFVIDTTSMSGEKNDKKKGRKKRHPAKSLSKTGSKRETLSISVKATVDSGEEMIVDVQKQYFCCVIVPEEVKMGENFLMIVDKKNMEELASRANAKIIIGDVYRSKFSGGAIGFIAVGRMQADCFRRIKSGLETLVKLLESEELPTVVAEAAGPGPAAYQNRNAQTMLAAVGLAHKLSKRKQNADGNKAVAIEAVATHERETGVITAGASPEPNGPGQSKVSFTTGTSYDVSRSLPIPWQHCGAYFVRLGELKSQCHNLSSYACFCCSNFST